MSYCLLCSCTVFVNQWQWHITDITRRVFTVHLPVGRKRRRCQDVRPLRMRRRHLGSVTWNLERMISHSDKNSSLYFTNRTVSCSQSQFVCLPKVHDLPVCALHCLHVSLPSRRRHSFFNNQERKKGRIDLNHCVQRKAREKVPRSMARVYLSFLLWDTVGPRSPSPSLLRNKGVLK